MINTDEMQLIIKITVHETLVQLGKYEETISQAEAKKLYKTRLKDFEDNGLVKPILIGTKKRYRIAELMTASTTNYKLFKFLVK